MQPTADNRDGPALARTMGLWALVIYGMARQGLVPGWLRRVHPRRRTPHLAILMLMVLVLILVSVGDLAALASATSVLLLCSFIVISASLLVRQRRAGEPPGAFAIPAVVPAGGILVCAALLTRASPRAMLIALALLAGIALLYVVRRPQAITAQSLTGREGE